MCRLQALLVATLLALIPLHHASLAAPVVRLDQPLQRSSHARDSPSSLSGTAAAIDETEPNNDPDNAQVLLGGAARTINGRAEVADAGIFYLSSLNDDLEDLYWFKSTAKGVRASLTGFAADCDLYLISPRDSSIIGYSITEGASAAEEINLPELPADSYWLAVSIFDPGQATSTATSYSLTLNASLTAQIAPPANLVSWWPGEGHALDIIGPSHGSLEKGALCQAGFVGLAFSFDGVDDYVYTPLDVQPAAMTSTTWECWVRPELINYTWRQHILSDDDGWFDRSLTIEHQTANFGVFTGTDIWQPAAVDVNLWQHLALVYEPNRIRFYKNGKEYILNKAPTGQNTVRTLHIGKSPDFNDLFKGLIDEVSVYNRALTANQIRAIYDCGVNGKIKPAAAGLQISGTISRCGSGEPVRGARLLLSPSPAPESRTDSLGHYLITLAGPGSGVTLQPAGSGMFFDPPSRYYASLSASQTGQDFTASLFGDLSANNEVTSYDAAMLLRYTVGLHFLTTLPRDSIAADVSGNGRLSAYDAALILRHAAGLIYSFPADQPTLSRPAAAAPAIPARIHLIRTEMNATGAEITFRIDNAASFFACEFYLDNPDGRWEWSKVPLSGQLEGVLIAAGAGSKGLHLACAVAAGFGEGLFKLALLRRPGGSPAATSGMPRLQSIRIDDGPPIPFMTSPEAAALLPLRLALAQNYPNPFNGSTTLSYELPAADAPADGHWVHLAVYDLQGRCIARLLEARQSPGRWSVLWDGRTGGGEVVPTGVYFAVLKSGREVAIRKMVMVQ